MFGKLGAIMGLLSNPAKLQEHLDKLQRRLGEIVCEGTAGAGMVTVKVNGKFTMLSCIVADDLMAVKDREMLEDLIVAATNQALDKARSMAAEETRKLAVEFGLPAGMNLPGLS